MTSLSPLSAAPVAALLPTMAAAPGGRGRVRDLPVTDAVWTVEITAPGAGGASPVPPPFGLVSALPVGAVRLPADIASAVPTIRVSDRGWITEPDDDVPNQAWPARLIEPPALEFRTPLYPSEPRRSEVTAGEIMLANADGALNALVSNWALAGLPVVIGRGPHRRPVQASSAQVGRVAEMRVARPLDGGARLRLTLGSAARDLSMPACPTFAGTGGQEGPASLGGQFKQRLLGERVNFAPTLVDEGRLIFLVSVGPILSISGVRNRAVEQTFAGYVGSYAELEAAFVPPDSYMACLSTGHIRLGSKTSLLTVSAQGWVLPEAGGYTGTAAQAATALLRGPGGVDGVRAASEAFSAWPTDPVGLLVNGGTVAEALDRIAAGVGGSWGADAFGRFRGDWLIAPEMEGPSVVIQPWMLDAALEEEPTAAPPWWRVRVSYAGRDVVQEGENVAPVVGQGVRDYFGRASDVATSFDAAVMSAFPAATDGPLIESAFLSAAPAAALASRLMAIFGKPRRSWRASIRAGTAGLSPAQLMPRAVVSLPYPRIASLAQGPNLLVRGLSARGDRLQLSLWG